jgi:hypothetical protein
MKPGNSGLQVPGILVRVRVNPDLPEVQGARPGIVGHRCAGKKEATLGRRFIGDSSSR